MKSTPLKFCLILAFSLFLSGSKIYKWVDEDGIAHFSDKKPENQQSDEIHIEKLPQTGEKSVPDDWAENWLGQQSEKREAEKLRRISTRQGDDACRTARRMLSRLETDCPIFYDQRGVITLVCPEGYPVIFYGTPIEDDERSKLISYYKGRLDRCDGLD